MLMRIKCVFVALLLLPLIAKADCYKSSVISPTPLMGNHNEIVILQDNSIWRIQYEYEYLYEYYPDVLICPSLGKMFVDDSELDVTPVAVQSTRPSLSNNDMTIRSRVDDDWEGWDGDTVIVLANGQIWQQDEYVYEYSYAYRPEVTILKIRGKWHMRVEGSNEWVAVRRLN